MQFSPSRHLAQAALGGFDNGHRRVFVVFFPSYEFADTLPIGSHLSISAPNQPTQMSDKSELPDDLPPDWPRGNAAESKPAWSGFAGDSAEQLPGAVGPSLGAEGVAPARTPIRPARRAGPSILGQFVGLVVGGALGLTIGYYLLNWLGGPQYNFLEIHLPGLPAKIDDLPIAGDEGANKPERPALPDSNPLPVEPAIVDQIEPAPTILPLPSTEDSKLPPNYVGPRHFTARHSEEVNAALLAVKALLVCDRCRSTGFIGKSNSPGKEVKPVPCDVCGGRSGGPLTPEMFAALCELGEMVTYSDAAPDEIVNIRRKEGIRAILLRATSSEEHVNAIARQAAEVLDRPTPPAGGIVIVGTVMSIERQGPLHLAVIKLPETGRMVTLASRHGFVAKLGESLAVLGTCVSRPQDELVGYQGDEPLVVWAGLAIRLQS